MSRRQTSSTFGGSVTAAPSEPPDDDDFASTAGDPDSRSPFLIRRLLNSARARAGRRRTGSGAGDPSGGTDDDAEDNAKGPSGLRLLHASPEPLIDIIFVHGLKGDSIKTWRKSGDPQCFWPQLWLPMEPDFENVNIYTFGYDSNWASTKSSILNVHDFGQGLLEEIRNAPQLRDSRPMILIGHSMGGLVIKKAYILAQDVPEFKTRIRTIFFLSTPHRGNDYASILNNILTVSGFLSSRHYLTDLTTGSVSLQLINDDFGRYAHDLPIFSFYEALKMKIGISSILVVDKDSAVLGSEYKNERVQYMNANHRDMCKFDSVHDPNYTRVRNALASAIGGLLKDVSITKREEARGQMKALRTYLGVYDSPEENHPKVNGSCQWIDARDDFQDWRDCATDLMSESSPAPKDKNLSVFWVHANPGTGKTVLASHIVSQLQELNLECAYHFFHAGDKASRSLGAFLRSVSYQMAMSNSAIREKLYKHCLEGSAFDFDDSRTIWTKIFKKGVLQSRVYTPQYWVIDALDECSKYQELFTMLKSEKPDFPLRIFITSRKVHDIQRLQKTLDSSATSACIEIPVQDSVHDIECYIQSRIDSLPIDNTADREELAIKILRKSNASFLWVRLVLDELESVYSSESTMKILEGIPEGMIPYYQRTVKAMAENTLEKHIAKAVLRWVMASSRKLTITELSHALELDIETVLPSAKSAVEGLCGQLVTVDNKSGVVDLIHPTVREFLLSSADEFTISKPQAHERVALVCLRLLSGNEMRPPRNPRLLSRPRPEPSPLLDYAITQFSEHIYLASSESDALLAAIDLFFRTNVLSWIERRALRGNLHSLIRASKNFKTYLERRAKYQSTLDNRMKNIDSWSTDLSRIVTQFGKALIQDPTSIFFLIPPLCPSGSAIHQSFGKRPDGLALVGRKSTSWNDCVAEISFGDDIAAAISCGESLIAAGMESGIVNLYNHRSCQKEAVIRHKNPVDLVHISDGFLASCTTRSLILQDLSGNLIWERRLRFRCLLLTSGDDCIVALSQHGHLLKWDRGTGEQIEDIEFPYRNQDEESSTNNGLVTRPPQVASISPDMEMLALGYRGGAVCLWDIRERDMVGWARDEAGRNALKLLFNPNPSIDLLLIMYTGQDLALYDTWSGSLVHSHVAPNNVGLLSASSSPDGRTLVTTDAQGNMHIWDFESLSILYHIHSPFPSFRILNFTSDGFSIVDVMDSSMRIWSPAVLVRRNTEEDASTNGAAAHLGMTEGEYVSRKGAKVTVLCEHPTSGIAFAGKYNGQVMAFNTKIDKSTTILYSHTSGSFVTKLAVTKSNVIASSDVTALVKLWTLASTAMKIDSLRAEIQTTSQVRQLCFSANGDYLLVATAKGDNVYRVSDGSLVGTWPFDPQERKTWRWFLLPHQETEDQHFSLLVDGKIGKYSARSFPRRIDDTEICLHYAHGEDGGDCEETGIDTAVVSPSTKTLVIEARFITGIVSSKATFFFDLTNGLSSSGSPITLEPLSVLLPKRCKHFLGFSQATKSFVFLHEDSWISSVNLSGLRENRYVRHFFVPHDYVSDSTEVLPIKVADNDAVFCQHGALISVKNGMKFSTARALE